MFTGLVEAVGKLTRLTKSGPSARARIQTAFAQAEPLELGESIAVNGVCLTVDAVHGSAFDADISAETLARTTLGALAANDDVNLERSMKLGGRMGGHIVLGHVDAVGKLTLAEKVGDAQRTVFEVGRELAAYLAPKGSIAIDGVSLTVNEVADRGDACTFSVMLVPHTLGRTTLASAKPGASVNIEIDVLARYVERQLGLARAEPAGASVKDEASLLEKLRSGGYM